MSTVESADILESKSTHPTYEEYKDSGVDWLGEIPAHWGTGPLKYFVSIDPEALNEGTDDDFKLKYADISSVSLTEGIKELEEYRFVDAPSRARKVVRHGDTIISTVRTYLKAIAYIDSPPENLIVSTGFAVLRPLERVDERFLGYLISSRQFIDSAVSNSEGIGYPSISTTKLGRLPIWLPPIDEQRAIAAFLDRETERIDALIEKKERLIDLLEEKRTALISRVVTKGLDEDVEMQDSGVEWLGEIPAGWEIISLGYCLDNITYGFTNPMPATDDGPYMLTANDIGNGEIKYESARHTTQEAFEERLTDKSRPLQGDILLTKDGTLGRVAVYDGRVACVNQSVAVLRPDNDMVDTNFLQHLLRSHSYHDMMLFDSGGSTIQHIYITRLAKMPIALPPLDEQRSIASYATQKRKSIDSLIERAEEGLDQLKEYRTALISAAVTGQIDVRENVQI